MGNLYGGAILKIDLSTCEITKRATSDYTDKYIGGRDINTRLLTEELDKKSCRLPLRTALSWV